MIHENIENLAWKPPSFPNSCLTFWMFPKNYFLLIFAEIVRILRIIGTIWRLLWSRLLISKLNLFKTYIFTILDVFFFWFCIGVECFSKNSVVCEKIIKNACPKAICGLPFPCNNYSSKSSSNLISSKRIHHLWKCSKVGHFKEIRQITDF